jgi:hypothetical protein
MTALIHQQLALAPVVNTLCDSIRQAKLRESNAERIGKLERDYREASSPLFFGMNGQRLTSASSITPGEPKPMMAQRSPVATLTSVAIGSDVDQASERRDHCSATRFAGDVNRATVTDSELITVASPVHSS